jgi:hypothetical protein
MFFTVSKFYKNLVKRALTEMLCSVAGTTTLDREWTMECSVAGTTTLDREWTMESSGKYQ